jgi:hypothetical protein
MTRNALALDPLDPPAMTPIQDTYSTRDPLALDPLSPISCGARPIDAHASDPKRTSEKA